MCNLMKNVKKEKKTIKKKFFRRISKETIKVLTTIVSNYHI